MEVRRPWFMLLLLMLTSTTVQNQIMQSKSFLHGDGTDFIPANPTELISDERGTISFMACYTRCNLNPLCRTFVSDLTTCRLYQGAIETGNITRSTSSTSRVGGLVYTPSLYTAYNQVCDPRAPFFDRYLVCINRSLSCPTGTYWNGSMCVNQMYYANLCSVKEACRADVGLQCSPCSKCSCNSTAIWNNTVCGKRHCIWMKKVFLTCLFVIAEAKMPKLDSP